MSDEVEFEVIRTVDTVDPHNIADYLRDRFHDDTLKEAIEDFNELVNDDAKNRHDIPAAVRTNMERYRNATEYLVDIVLLLKAEDEDCGQA